MRSLNSNNRFRLLTDPDWTYDKICAEFRKSNPAPVEIVCGIVAFNDLLNDIIDNGLDGHFCAITNRVILDAGHFANLEIDGQWLPIYVEKGITGLGFGF